MPARERINVDADSGFQGIHKEWPGANVWTPHKRSKCADLTPAQKRENLELSRVRVAVEHSICMIKQYDRMCGPYESTHANYDKDRTVEEVYGDVICEYRKELDIITGLVNLKLAWDDIKANRGPVARIMREKRRRLGLK